jgi:hypothetical protein
MARDRKSSKQRQQQRREERLKRMQDNGGGDGAQPPGPQPDRGEEVARCPQGHGCLHARVHVRAALRRSHRLSSARA